MIQYLPKKNQFQNDCYVCFLFNALFNSVCNQDPGELLGILGGGVHRSSLNPDPIMSLRLERKQKYFLKLCISNFSFSFSFLFIWN